MQVIDKIKIWGEPLMDAVQQAKVCLETNAETVMLMADHHIGYAVPIGGVVAYSYQISPSGVGFDIGCGNKAVRLDVKAQQIKPKIKKIMDDIWKNISFGVGRANNEQVDHALFDDQAWKIPVIAGFKKNARQQLGTVGSGNHYVDIFADENEDLWIGVHFGSRGLGHRIASHFISAGGGIDGINVPPVVFPVQGNLGSEYLECMRLAGEYAYAGRDWVCSKVAALIGGRIVEEIHNHHNFAWKEIHEGNEYWVVRKGATPCFPGQKSFVGATMSEPAVIIEGIESEESKSAFYSTVHGAGRVLSRTKAAGKFRFKNGKRIKIQEGQISREMLEEEVIKAKVELRGAGTDESPHCYKRLTEVLKYHENTLKVLHRLTPIGVAMAGEGEFDPYKD